MIFVTLGSQKFQFNRLLKAIDEVIENGIIQEEVFAQIGYSDYKPKKFKYKAFLDRDEFVYWQEKADIVITHGGTGAIIGALKKGKKVVAVPRLAKYKEHVDDHQLEILNQFQNQSLIEIVNDCSCLEYVLISLKTKEFNKYKSNTNNILSSIRLFIEKQKEY